MEKTWPSKCPKCNRDDWQDEGIVDMGPDGITIEWRCGLTVDSGCGTSIHLNFGKFCGFEINKECD